MTPMLGRLARDPWARVAGIGLLLLVLVAVFAPAIAPYDPNRQLDIIALKDRPPSLAHWFGTDPYGRDVLSRVIFGARISLAVAVLAVLAATTAGLAYGAVAGMAGPRTDAVLMRVLDVCLAVPRVLLLVAITALWGEISLATLILVLGLTGWFTLGRMVRADVRAVRAREFVLGARALGASPTRILGRHVLPHVLSTVIVWATLDIGQVILLEAGLSFLGLGVQPPTASWGTVMQDGADRLAGLWWMSVFPGLAIVLTVAAVALLGERLRDALDPRDLPHR